MTEKTISKLTAEHVRKARLAIIERHVKRLAGAEADTLMGLITQITDLPGREAVNLHRQLELI